MLSSSEKRNFELQNKKLEAEINQLQKPYWGQPSSWISATVALVGVVGVLGQSIYANVSAERKLLAAEVAEQTARIETQQAQAKVEEADLEVTRLNQERETLLQEKSSIEQSLETLMDRNHDLQDRNANLAASISALTDQENEIRAQLDALQSATSRIEDTEVQNTRTSVNRFLDGPRIVCNFAGECTTAHWQ
jgi:DNA repair exonuclease SbcCD ATPase subunit